MCYERYVDEGYDAKLGFLWKSVLFVSISYCLANWFYIKLMFCWNLRKTWISMRFNCCSGNKVYMIFWNAILTAWDKFSLHRFVCVSIRKLLLRRFMCVSIRKWRGKQQFYTIKNPINGSDGQMRLRWVHASTMKVKETLNFLSCLLLFRVQFQEYLSFMVIVSKPDFLKLL